MPGITWTHSSCKNIQISKLSPEDYTLGLTQHFCFRSIINMQWKQKLSQIIPLGNPHKTLLNLLSSVLEMVQKAEEALSACLGINLGPQTLRNHHLHLHSEDFCKLLRSFLPLSDVAEVGQCLHKLPAVGWLRNEGFIPATLTKTVKPSWDLKCKWLSKSGHPPVWS